MMKKHWEPGQVIARREVLGLAPAGVPDPDPLPPWHGSCWAAMAAHVVADTEAELVLYVAPGAEHSTPPGSWPTPDGLHPWHAR